jgi:putative transposase
MRAAVQRFLLFLAGASDKELARAVEYLRAENRILRARLPRRLEVTARERRTLLKFGKRLGSKIRDLITIVTPRTFLRWLRGERQAGRSRPGNPGRPRTPDDIRQLVLRLARENAWGYTRILGELKKLGVHSVTKNTVRNILKAEGLDPGPQRGSGSWDEFIRRHAATLWATDFFSKKVWTMKGLVDVYVLFFLHVGSRRVYVSGITAHPDGVWMKQQARNVAMHFAEQAEKPTLLLRDNDTKYTREFDAILESEGVEVKKVTPASPNLNAYAERFVQSAKQECLDHFVVFGEDHLRYIVTEYVRHHNEERPHQARNNEPLGGLPAALADCLADLTFSSPHSVRCHERLGGLLKSYSRAA